jgi:dihydropteroate synthase
MSAVRRCFKIHAVSRVIKLGIHTQVMGILNATADSFSGDGLYRNKKDVGSAVDFAQKLISDGADIIDIGGESTRPGAKPVSVEDEIKRVIPLVKAISRRVKVPISVDTYKPDVARHALDEGACIINTVMGVNPQKDLLRFVCDARAALILMHIKGTPQTMQNNPKYKNVVAEIKKVLRKSVENCLEIGIRSDRLIIDPGLGFGKTLEHNLEIINSLERFKDLQFPILVGPSRKSFIGKILNKNTDERLYGTIASVCAAVMNGAHIVRVHDVKAVKEALTVIDGIIHQTNKK